jgi:RHS repeat-associated protein
MARFAVVVHLFSSSPLLSQLRSCSTHERWCVPPLRIAQRRNLKTVQAKSCNNSLRTLLLVLAMAGASFSQNTPGVQDFSTNIFGVDLATGNVNIQIPIRSKIGAIPFRYFLNGNSGITTTQTPAAQTTSIVINTLFGTRVIAQGTPVQYDPNNGGALDGAANGNYTDAITGAPCGGVTTIYQYWGVVDSTGATHLYKNAPLQSQSGGCYTLPSSATTLDGLYTTTFTTSPPVVTDNSGRTLNATGAATPIEDADQHEITFGSNAYADTLDTTALTLAGTPASGGGPYYLEYTDDDLKTQKFTVSYTSYTAWTAFGCTSPALVDVQNNQDGSNTEAQLILPTTITTPTGATYSFSYESQKSGTGTYGSYTTGRIAKVVYPAGGYIEYAYSGGNSGLNCTSLAVPTLQVTVNDNNGGNSGTWKFVNGNTSAQANGLPYGNYTVTGTDPAGNQTIYSFSGEYQTQAVYYQGTSTILKTVLTCYNKPSTCSATPSSAVALPITETDVRTSLNTSSAKRVTTTFDTYGNRLVTSAYDFGGTVTSPTGTLLSVTTNVYGQSYSSATVCSTYTSGSIHNTPCYSHTGPTSTTDLAETKVSYNTDGKPASLSRWTGATTNTWLITSFGYGANGAAPGILSSITDVNNAITSHESFDCNGMLPASTTYALSSVGSDSQVWNCNGGVLTSYTDVNGNKTTYTYDDPLWRLTAIADPDEGGQSFSYSTGSTLPWTNYTQVLVYSGQSYGVTITLDGLGRAILSQSTDPNVSTDLRYGKTVFNNLGQVVDVYNPYFATSDPTYGYTAYTYDALGRITQKTPPSGAGAAETFTYTNRATEHIVYPSNNAFTTISQIDGLGRVNSICEVTSTKQANGQSPASCGLDISGTGFEASNTYDALGNVLSTGYGSTRSFTYDGLSRVLTATYPEESGTVSYTYNSAGDLATRVAPLPNQTSTNTETTTYTHDAMHRLTGMSYSDGTTPAVVYNYDQSSVWSTTLTNPKGRLSSASADSVVNAAFGYDTMGRVAIHGQCTPLNCGTTNFWANYSYNYIGEPLGGTDYLAISWTNTYNNIGQLTEVSNTWLSPTENGTVVSDILYNALGEPTSDSLGDGETESWTYNHDGHATSYGQNPAPGYNYGFSSTNLAWNGDFLTSSTDNVNGAWTYTYDNLARLATAVQSGGQSFSYSYDEYGNRWGTIAGTTQYSFNGATNQITNGGITYDAAGNMTYDGFHTYMYDGENRLKEVDSGNTAIYNYDAFGNRNMQYAPPVYNEYVVDLSGRAITAVEPGTSTVYTAEVFAGGRHWVTDNGGALFIGADWVETSRALTYLSGSFNQLYTSYPWGDNLSNTGNPGNSSYITRWQFTGKEYDPESNLYHFPARQYAPVQGRWLTPDPAGLAAMDVTNPQSWNRYTYGMNNPVSASDPSGLLPFSIMAESGSGDSGSAGFCPAIDETCEDDSPFYQQANQLTGVIASASRMNIPCDFGVCGDYFTNPIPTEGGIDGADYTFYTTVFLDPSASSAAAANSDPYQNAPPISRYLRNLILRPWSFGLLLPIEIPAGPAFTLSFDLNKGFACLGVGGGVGARGVNGGPLWGDTQNSGAILSGWSASINVAGPIGVQRIDNLSGTLYGPTVGAPGASVAVTYSWCAGNTK